MSILGEFANPAIQRQSCTNLPIHHQFANLSQVCQSITKPRIQCKSWTNLQIHHQSLSFCQSTNRQPIQGKSHSSMPVQPINNPPKQYLTDPPMFCQSTSPWPNNKVDQPCISINRRHSDHSHWHSIDNGRANTRPIRVTKPHLLKGTSTIQSQLLSGQHSFRTTLNCRHNVIPWTIKCQSTISMLPIMCQSIADPPMECHMNHIPTTHLSAPIINPE